MHSFIDYSNEVKLALANNKPVLALESTLITHGLPYPDNFNTGKELENIAREQDVTPATIALMNGKIKIGLEDHELEALVQDKQAQKASKRDIPFYLSTGINAGTTVAGTLFCANLANIKVFATGGIGGVHRGDAFDISADLTELSKTPIAVVCAGAKAILDIGKTLEQLETLSIPVIGFGTTTFPAFYSRESAFTLSAKVDTVDALVKVLTTHWQIGAQSGILIANPVPKEHDIAHEVIAPVIERALKKALDQHVTGKAITPFLLSEVLAGTKGKSMEANIALIKNNVSLGALIARDITK